MDEIAETLWRACYSAKRQLDGMGKGREPSERLQAAFDRAAELLGFDPTERQPDFDDD